MRNKLNANELSSFEDANEKWEIFCEAWANFVAGDEKTGGSIRPLMYANATEYVIKDRIKMLERFKRLSDPR